jgi:hypothetical protein
MLFGTRAKFLHRGTRDSDSNHESMDLDSRPAGLGLESQTLGLGLNSRYAGLGLGKRWTRYISNTILVTDFNSDYVYYHHSMVGSVMRTFCHMLKCNIEMLYQWLCLQLWQLTFWSKISVFSTIQFIFSIHIQQYN